MSDGARLAAIVAASVAVAAIGLALIRNVPAAPPDAAFAQRVAAWRSMAPTPRPSH